MYNLTHLTKTKTKNQIANFLETICVNENKVIKRFIQDMIFGITVSKSVLLSEISRSLKEKISLKKTIERLSNNLKKEMNFAAMEEKYLTTVKSEINTDTVIAVDDGDMTKEYATKFEKLALVKDGNQKDKPCKLGYNTTNLFAVNASKEKRELIPLLGKLYSTKEEYFKTGFEEVKDLISRLVKIIGSTGIYVLDRGFDSNKVINYLNGLWLTWLIRMTKRRNIKTLKGKVKKIEDFAQEIRKKYGEVELFYGQDKDGYPKKLRGRLGFRRCIINGKVYTLIVIAKFNGKVGMMLLTNKKINGIKDMKQMLSAYNARWSVEDHFRCIKQSFKLEKWMVRSLQSVKNLYRLVNLLTACIGKIALNDYLKKLILYIKEQALDVYDKTKFYICALAKGISNILGKYTSKYWLKDKIIDKHKISLPLIFPV